MKDGEFLTVHDLNRDQIVSLKQSYLSELGDEGVLNEVVRNRPDWDDDGEHGLSMDDLADADSLVPDEVVFDHYAGQVFTRDDFVCDDGDGEADGGDDYVGEGFEDDPCMEEA